MARRKKNLRIEEIFEASENVAERLTDERLTDIGIDVVQGYEIDENSRAEWTERHKDMMKLALQVVEKKNEPWEGASNVKYPLLTRAAINFAARVDLFRGNDKVRVQTVGYDPMHIKTDRAVRLSKHMSYQLTKQMVEWEDDNDRMMHALPIAGSMFKKTYYCPLRSRPVSDLVSPLNLVFDYHARSVETAKRKTHLIGLTPNEVQQRIRSGIFLDRELDMFGTPMERSLDQEHEGLSESMREDDDPRLFLEQQRLLDLDGDDFAEPYTVTVDHATKQVFRIVPCFYPEDIHEAQGKIYLIDPTEYYTHFGFIPDPNMGNLGIGFGSLQGPLNEVANTLVNQLIDSGTLQNMGGGVVSSSLRTKRGEFEVVPGMWQSVNSIGGNIRDAVMPWPVAEPSQVLFLLLQMIIESGEQVGSITDAITGETPPPNTPATTVLATIEQGLMVFKKISTRLYRSFSKEFTKIYKINSRHLSAQEYFSVLDIPQSQIERLRESTRHRLARNGLMQVLRQDYKYDNDVYPSADPSMTTRVERMQKIEALMQAAPLLGIPVEPIKQEYVEILELPDPDRFLQPPPQQPPPYQIIVEQMRQQGEQAQAQMNAQIEQAKLQVQGQMKQMQLGAEAPLKQAEIEKIQMEIAKLAAEIRKILADIGETDQTGNVIDLQKHRDSQKLEEQKMRNDVEAKRAEIALKQQELEIKKAELRGSFQEDADAMNSGLATIMDQIARMQERKPIEIERDEGTNLMTKIGDRTVERDETGQVVRIV